MIASLAPTLRVSSSYQNQLSMCPWNLLYVWQDVMLKSECSTYTQTHKHLYTYKLDNYYIESNFAFNKD